MCILCSSPSLITPLQALHRVWSGTNNAGSGVLHRLTHHHADQLPSTPVCLSRRLFEDGYEAEHIGLLCWTPLPSSAGLVSKSSRLHLRQSKHSLMAFVFHVGITMITAQRYSNTSSMMTLAKHYHRNDSSSFLCGCFLPQRA